MEFTQLSLTAPVDWVDILIAELAQIGYESFVETENGVDAYVQTDQFSEAGVQEIIRKYDEVAQISYSVNHVARQNWNEEWEKNYPPVMIEDQCIVRASFHQVEKPFRYEIIINPKMSFGTGHHETTSLMLSNQLEMDFTGKRVMDVGSGTGILAVMAAKKGAAWVDAFDTEEWAVENAIENSQLNGVTNIRIQQGTIQEVQLGGPYGIVLANINRNVLLQEIPLYVSYLVPDGYLLISGFYEQDIDELDRVASKHHLQQIRHTTKHQWASVLYRKNKTSA